MGRYAFCTWRAKAPPGGKPSGELCVSIAAGGTREKPPTDQSTSACSQLDEFVSPAADPVIRQTVGNRAVCIAAKAGGRQIDRSHRHPSLP